MTDYSKAKVPMSVVIWAADECERQRSGEQSVANMVRGWLYARRRSIGGGLPDVAHVRELGHIIEPIKNRRGLREVGVRVGSDVKMAWQQVPRALDGLMAEVQHLGIAHQEDADRWYHQYEEIHPFVDGNGRTGSILWNWLSGTLTEPCDPPNFWDYDMYWNTPRKPSSAPAGGDAS